MLRQQSFPTARRRSTYEQRCPSQCSTKQHRPSPWCTPWVRVLPPSLHLHINMETPRRTAASVSAVAPLNCGKKWAACSLSISTQTSARAKLAPVCSLPEALRWRSKSHVCKCPPWLVIQWPVPLSKHEEGQRESAKEGDGADEQFNMSHIVAVQDGGREVVLDTGSAAVSCVERRLISN